MNIWVYKLGAHENICMRLQRKYRYPMKFQGGESSEFFKGKTPAPTGPPTPLYSVCWVLPWDNSLLSSRALSYLPKLR